MYGNMLEFTTVSNMHFNHKIKVKKTMLYLIAKCYISIFLL